MGYTPPAGAEAVVENRLTPSVITLEFAAACHARLRQLVFRCLSTSKSIRA